MAGGRETRGGAASAARAAGTWAGTEVVVRSCGAPRVSRRIADVRGSCRRTDPRSSDDGGVEANAVSATAHALINHQAGRVSDTPRSRARSTRRPTRSTKSRQADFRSPRKNWESRRELCLNNLNRNAYFSALDNEAVAPCSHAAGFSFVQSDEPILGAETLLEAFASLYGERLNACMPRRKAPHSTRSRASFSRKARKPE